MDWKSVREGSGASIPPHQQISERRYSSVSVAHITLTPPLRMTAPDPAYDRSALDALIADARAVAGCVVIDHDGGASTEQVAGVLGWPAERLIAAVEWLVRSDLLSVTPSHGEEWPVTYLRQSARTAAFLAS